MWFERMTLEVWFDDYQYEVDFDLGESAVKYHTVGDLGVDLDDVALRYGHHRGLPSLREAIVDQYPGLSVDDVVVTTGASEANFVVASALLEPGSHAVVEHPNYPSLYDVPKGLHADLELIRLEFADDFRLDIDRLEAMLRPDTRLVTLTHPNNPTGATITEDELARVVDLIERQGRALLLFDETYRDLTYGDAPLPPAALLSDRAISMSTMSKIYGLPGTRIGWIATRNRELVEAAVGIRELMSITNNAVGEVLATSVLHRREQFLARSRSYIQENLETVDAWIRARSDIAWVRPQAGVVGFPRIDDRHGFDPEKLYRSLAEDYRTFTVPGRCFGMDNHHFRLGFGAAADELEAGLANLASALDTIGD